MHDHVSIDRVESIINQYFPFTNESTKKQIYHEMKTRVDNRFSGSSQIPYHCHMTFVGENGNKIISWSNNEKIGVNDSDNRKHRRATVHSEIPAICEFVNLRKRNKNLKKKKNIILFNIRYTMLNLGNSKPCMLCTPFLEKRKHLFSKIIFT
jgi:hypothetical protein